ncbi:hypothetical protein [Bradyrhizobium japonicum]|uniref:hypothetical protein n=1 Tax=Bradyrhizobium japonicum TaxID=375 RepID=UPI002714FF45|nr:hypothetical protein [Bradyrhizobium japonicum]WLB14976.1 hypothetical protein QIH95_23175 [Bradyrhizobium japonicum]
MDRRRLIQSLVGATCAAMVSGPVKAISGGNKIIGGGFLGGVGEHNIITGDESTARNAILNYCVINGRGAAAEARGSSTTCIGDACGIGADFEICDLSGQYAGHNARLRKVTGHGYAALEYADAEDSTFVGLYSGHSCFARHSHASGVNSLNGAIVHGTIASGRDAGAYAEGEDLVMHGAYVTTARVPGPELPVSEIQVDRDLTPWIIKAHGFGAVGTRVNLFAFGDEMPRNKHTDFINGLLYPFLVLDADAVSYVGNKYAAETSGRNLRLAINTCRPKRSIAIGKGSLISRDDQVVVNGRDFTDVISRVEALESRLNAIERLTPP